MQLHELRCYGTMGLSKQRFWGFGVSMEFEEVLMATAGSCFLIEINYQSSWNVRLLQSDFVELNYVVFSFACD